ncbi:MAG: pyruvate:ferredoxin (flavodoxin) oxidoreductase [Bacilli bacterium]|nr:pyruvate:ferredoxin (flavodoxin) oxidoreductase [Bacilli bacterium]
MKKITVDGNEAVAKISYMFTEVAGIYPITPSSPMAAHIDEWSTTEKNIFGDNVKVVEMQSEAGAAGLVHGSLNAGLLTSTYTASQGLLLMIPNMYKIAGEMLPCVMNVAARSLSTHALSIFGDHQDVYATRSTGFCMLASSSVQDAAHLTAVAHLSAIKASLPFMHFFDGFRTSHEIDKIDIMEMDELKPLLDKKALKKFRDRSLNPMKPYTIGTAQNDDVYFQNTEARNKYYEDALIIVEDYMNKINKITGMDYKPFNYYGSPKATKVIVAMGSVCETIKEVIDYTKEDIGLIEVHLYRPFSAKHLLNVLPKTVSKVAVLDRTKEAGSNGEPLYLDVKNVLCDLEVVGGRYGLSSKDTTPGDIYAVYKMLDKPINNFTIGIDDDLTYTSLERENITTSNSDEILIYGYGSDGMVSASKSLIKLVGNLTDKYVQGYFQYDSKKSGGVTKCHLRFNDNIIRSTYYVSNPSLIVITKDIYLTKFDTLSNIKENGTVIINTVMDKDEFLKYIPSTCLAILKDKNVKLYIINANKVADKIGLGNKISTIMESIIVKISNLVDYNEAKKTMKEYAHNRYFKKGEEVVKANYDAIDLGPDYLEEVDYSDTLAIIEDNDERLSTIEMVNDRMGDTLPTSAFVPNGITEPGTALKEKRNTSDTIPKYIPSNCISCGMCSLYCPHGVIRIYELSEEEYNKAPDNIKERCIKVGNTYNTIGISAKDCTGCGVCAHNCPGKGGNKALEMILATKEEKEEEQKIFDYLDKHISNNTKMPLSSVKGSQLKRPKFCFSGACAGCGETPYLKLLTQLFGDNMIISNATGCSSIYGASYPSTPYSIPWASSLFEDNAEYGYGILLANEVMKNRIKNIMENNMDNSNKKLFSKWLENPNDYENTKYVYDNLTDDIPDELKDIKDYIVSKVIWTIGGDGWAYDIGFGGIDHVLASNDNVNILVLDSQVYSNTGGQASKATPKGVIAEFASAGKKTSKKDLARIAMSYPNVYVGQVCLGANPMATIKVMMEAANHKGPSIIIAYTPCISHGIKGGLVNSVDVEKKASESGYFPIFHYNPDDKKFTLDTKVDFDKYDEFLETQTRYSMLKVVNPNKAKELLEENKKEAIERFKYYEELSTKDVK